MNSPDLIDLLREHRVIAVARDVDREQAPSPAGALREGGIRILEITVEAENGIGAIAALGDTDLVIGQAPSPASARRRPRWRRGQASWSRPIMTSP
jgi:hypothetical protein